QAAHALFPGNARHGGIELARPVAFGRARYRAAGETARAVEVDMRGRGASERLDRAEIAAPVRRQFELVGIDGQIAAALGIAPMDIGEGTAECADAGQIFDAGIRAPAVDVVGCGAAHALGTAE